MALTVTTLPRVFRFNNQEFADPNPQLDEETVKRIFAAQHPELATATIEGPDVKNGSRVFTFQTRVGHKG